MKSSKQNTARTPKSDPTHFQASQNKGQAIHPPASGIDIVDTQTVQRMSAPQPVVSAPVSENKTGLPDNLKTGIETLSGYAMDDVKVHYNSAKPAQLQAFAYTQGTDIHVAPGQERYLPHEAWHVVQQKQGRVKPTLQAKGMPVNNDRVLEHEADQMGMKALQNRHHFANTIQSRMDEPTTIQRAESMLAPSYPHLSSVIQMATILRFDNNITGNDVITATQHNRTGVHNLAMNWVFDNGAWEEVPGGTVCNHSKGYDNIAQDILNDIHGKTLSAAADSVTDIYNNLKGNNQGIGNPTSTHQNRLYDIVNHPANVVNVDNVLDSFNYYIYKICDYPRNLFFWPYRTGNDPDEPYGEYGSHGDWKVSNGIISNKTRLTREKKRLADGRQDIVNALP